MRTVECGNDEYLNLLTVGELSALCERAWQARRKQTQEMLNDAQAGEESAIKEMRALYDMRGTRLPAIMYAMTLDGARDIIETACKSQNKTPDRVMDGVSADRLVEIAARLVGHDPEAVRKESERGE